MSNIVWSPENGWHNGREVTVTAENGRIATAETCSAGDRYAFGCTDDTCYGHGE